MTESQTQFKRKLKGFGVLLVFLFFAVMTLTVYKAVAGPLGSPGSPEQQETAAEGHESGSTATDPGVIKFAFLAAAIAVGVGSLGAGAAVGYVGAAAMGAIGEKPELAGRALIFVGLAEGIAIYGLIISIMILGKI
jgi:V/A-type H+-transporting ATPase subunit K